MSLPHFYAPPGCMDSYYWIANRLKHHARMIEKESRRERIFYPPLTNSIANDGKSFEEFDATEAVEIIISAIDQVIGEQNDYIKELAQKWSDRIINVSLQRLRHWRSFRYQGVCTISQRTPNQYVATTFSGDPASRGECSLRWHNGNISVLVLVRGYNNF